VIATKFGFDIDPVTGESHGLNSRPARRRTARRTSPPPAARAWSCGCPRSPPPSPRPRLTSRKDGNSGRRLGPEG
jgi:hypothetical protein